MCFSPEISFSSAGLLGLIAILTRKASTSKSQFFLAAIPLFFAVQQFSEGILWLELSHQMDLGLLKFWMQNIFLFFAFLIWPVWIPLSLLVLETISWRRYVLQGILACGIFLSLLNLSYAFSQEITIQIINHSIHYGGKAPPQAFVYPLIILLPCFISSYRKIWMFGILIAISYAIAEYYYEVTFISVWCFFCAIASAVIYRVIKSNQENGNSLGHSQSKLENV